MIVEKQTVLKTERFCEINIVLAISLRLNHVRWYQSCSWLVAFVKGVTAIEVLQKDKKVYNAEEIQEILGIGRSKTYTFLDEAYRNQKPFRVLKVGKLFRVPKQSFDDWLNQSSQGRCQNEKRKSTKKQIIL